MTLFSSDLVRSFLLGFGVTAIALGMHIVPQLGVA